MLCCSPEGLWVTRTIVSMSGRRKGPAPHTPHCMPQREIDKSKEPMETLKFFYIEIISACRKVELSTHNLHVHVYTYICLHPYSPITILSHLPFFSFPLPHLFLSYMRMFCVCVCVLFPDTAVSLNTPVHFLKIRTFSYITTVQ